MGWAWSERDVVSLDTGLYLKNEVIECTHFLHAGGNSGKLKVITVILGGHGENRRGDLSTLDLKI